METETATPAPFAQTEDGALTAEGQGPFAPESLPNDAVDRVFSRRFSNGVQVVTVYAAPVIPDSHLYSDNHGEEPPFYDVLTCTETRDADDDGKGHHDGERDDRRAGPP